MGQRWVFLGAAMMLAAASCMVLLTTGRRGCHIFPSRLHVEQVAAAVEQYRIDTGHLPASLDDLPDEGPPGLGPYIKASLSRDHWGRALLYSVDPDGRGFTVFSLGRDGRLGGSGADADVGRALPDD
jgi:hypothetical protein